MQTGEADGARQVAGKYAPDLVSGYTLLNEIGRGSFAVVFLARRSGAAAAGAREYAAIKVVSRSKLNRKLAENLESEIAILRKVRHEHVVNLAQIEESPHYVSLVMEYCSWNDLAVYIKRRGLIDAVFEGSTVNVAVVAQQAEAELATAGSGKPSTSAVHARVNQALLAALGLGENPLGGPLGGLAEFVVRRFARQLASALAFLRAHHLIHRDLKPQNILLCPPSRWTALPSPLQFAGEGGGTAALSQSVRTPSTNWLHRQSSTSHPISVAGASSAAAAGAGAYGASAPIGYGPVTPVASIASRGTSGRGVSNTTVGSSVSSSFGSSTASLGGGPAETYRAHLIQHLSTLLPRVKIADFGFARVLPQQALASTLCGSPLYMAPEILRYEKYDAKADLWSLGAVIYECVTGRVPYRAQNHVELLRKIEKHPPKFPDDALRLQMAAASAQRLASGVSASGRGSLWQLSPPSIPATSAASPASVASSPFFGARGAIGGASGGYATISEDLRALIKGLLRKSPIERLGFDEVFQHPCIALDGYGAPAAVRAAATAATAPASLRSASGLSGLGPLDDDSGAAGSSGLGGPSGAAGAPQHSRTTSVSAVMTDDEHANDHPLVPGISGLRFDEDMVSANEVAPRSSRKHTRSSSSLSSSYGVSGAGLGEPTRATTALDVPFPEYKEDLHAFLQVVNAAAAGADDAAGGREGAPAAGAEAAAEGTPEDPDGDYVMVAKSGDDAADGGSDDDAPRGREGTDMIAFINNLVSRGWTLQQFLQKLPSLAGRPAELSAQDQEIRHVVLHFILQIYTRAMRHLQALSAARAAAAAAAAAPGGTTAGRPALVDATRLAQLGMWLQHNLEKCTTQIAGYRAPSGGAFVRAQHVDERLLMLSKSAGAQELLVHQRIERLHPDDGDGLSSAIRDLKNLQQLYRMFALVMEAVEANVAGRSSSSRGAAQRRQVFLRGLQQRISDIDKRTAELGRILGVTV